MGEEEKGNFGKGFFGGEVEEFGRVGMGIAGKIGRASCRERGRVRLKEGSEWM